jgi:hypothetical protein
MGIFGQLSILSVNNHHNSHQSDFPLFFFRFLDRRIADFCCIIIEVCSPPNKYTCSINCPFYCLITWSSVCCFRIVGDYPSMLFIQQMCRIAYSCQYFEITIQSMHDKLKEKAIISSLERIESEIKKSSRFKVYKYKRVARF